MTDPCPHTHGTESVKDKMQIESPQSMVESGCSQARAMAASLQPDARMEFARTMVFEAISAYWQELNEDSPETWELRDLPEEVELSALSMEAEFLASSIGVAAAKLDLMEAGYAMGLLYTTLMPNATRARTGAYYTPPALCERLLDMAAAAGVDWRTARILDPACGGGAFLSPVAKQMAESLKGQDASEILGSIETRLQGFEIDPFAAWISQVLLDVTLGDLCREAGKRLKQTVRVCDSLDQDQAGDEFDLVVGNPPYGRTRLSSRLREKFRRSLFGHANLYGVFTDQALRFARPDGVIAYVTPTSFLAGEYFKALRGLLGKEAPPVSIEFVKERKGVFSGVLQETLLATYKCGSVAIDGKVGFLSQYQNGRIKRKSAGSFSLPKDSRQPWLMPRSPAHCELVRKADELPYRLADYGYKVSTGPLVWNRHKRSLRNRPAKGRYPLVWAESVRTGGEFSFRAEKRNHQPYFEPSEDEQWVVTEFPCVLIQRTTAKEQSRRLIAAELPADFIRKHGAVVVENHLNMIKPLNGEPKVAPATLAALLNSNIVDQVFRCINGSVAVSAYELGALPLPPPESMEEIEKLVSAQAERQQLESAVERLYGNKAA